MHPCGVLSSGGGGPALHYVLFHLLQLWTNEPEGQDDIEAEDAGQS